MAHAFSGVMYRIGVRVEQELQRAGCRIDVGLGPLFFREGRFSE